MARPQVQTSMESANSPGDSVGDVPLHVRFQVALLGEPLGTEVAAEWPFPCVCSLVRYQVGLVVGSVSTKRALVPALMVRAGTPPPLAVHGEVHQWHSSRKQGASCNSGCTKRRYRGQTVTKKEKKKRTKLLGFEYDMHALPRHV